MRNDVQKAQGDFQRSTKANGFYKAISGYLRIVSSGASTVACSVKSAGLSVASSLADDDAARDQVQWSGFDKLECEGKILREVLLLGYRSGFEVWDVEEADNVHQLASRRDGSVSFLQVQKKPTALKKSDDKFESVRPLLVVAGDSSNSGVADGYNASVGGHLDHGSDNFVSTNIQFYSLKTHAYVHVLKFRSAIYAVRCSPRVVAISLATQIHCFNAATLERDYTILTYPLTPSLFGAGSIGYGPLAVGSRWLAYCGSPVLVSSVGRVSPQHLNSVKTLSSSPSNGSLVAQYAKESSKQLASGIVTLGDIGYKKLSKYCSELLQEGNSPAWLGILNSTSNGATNNNNLDSENAGMVIVRDLVSKSVLVQFRAHRSPISALCFDPSGTLLVTASIHGHNINIFRIFPSCDGSTPEFDASGSYAHLFRLQRGVTDAVIQDISFSLDSQYIMISSSRGTSHLFALPPLGCSRNIQLNDVNFAKGTVSATNKSALLQSRSCSCPFYLNHCNNLFCQPSSAITLTAISRIRNGSNGWKGAVTGAAAAAAGRANSQFGATSSAFHHCKGGGVRVGHNSIRTKHHLLVFSPSGCLVQYALHLSNEVDSTNDIVGMNHGSRDLSQDSDSRVVVDAIQKWDICHKRHRRDHANNLDIYGENGNGDGTKPLPKTTKKGTSVYPADGDKASVLNLSNEERQHAYISAVELHTHSSRVLWTKPEIYFQVILDNPKVLENINLEDGESEIERIPTRIIEAKPKTLIPTFDHGFQQSRLSNDQSYGNGMFFSEKSDSLLGRKHSRGSSGSSVESMPTEIPCNIALNDGDSEHSPDVIKEPVHTRDSLNVNNQPEFVNKNGYQKAGTGLVNTVGSLRMESRFLDGDNEID